MWGGSAPGTRLAFAGSRPSPAGTGARLRATTSRVGPHRTALALASLALAAATLLEGCGAGDLESIPERSPLPDAGSWGVFLEDLRLAAPAADTPRRIVRPLRVEGVEPTYHRIAIRSDAPLGGEVQASFLGAQPRQGARFVYPCEDFEEASLHFWIFTKSGSEMQTLELRLGERRIRVPLPLEPGRLFRSELGLGSVSCSSEAQVVLELASCC